MLHWDGRTWTQVSSPSPGSDNQLFGVHMTSATDGWAVGLESNSVGQDLTLVLHWDGTSWTQVSSPSPGGSTGGSFLNGVAMVGTADVWSAGGTVFDSTGQERTLLLHWNGRSWTRF